MNPNEKSKNPYSSNVHPRARIHPDARVAPTAIIQEDVEIGEGTTIGPNVVIYNGVRIGNHCSIMPGVTLSADISQLEFWREEKVSEAIKPRMVIGNHVHIEPSATLHGGITIGDGSWIGSHTTIHDGARIGKNCRIFPGAIISAIPQDLKFDGERTTLVIGDNTTIRECATLNRGTSAHGQTSIGQNVLIMAYTHVAHDCQIGNHVVLANAVNLAGHVEIEDHVVIGGVSAVHQFVKIGRHAFVSGGSLVRKDVPPYVKAGRNPVKYEGVNSIGLRRRGYTNEVIHGIQDIYRSIFLSGMNTSKALDYVETHLPATEERDEVITFIRKATRGIIRGHS
ncbi:MAG: acyl-ACP--UDP-N-acetylglucosamine O-acyltransferase [Bacteroidetes bacterium]|nr:acyl-ACP--UDP-N-acetylglucosamine O-acyltransferase [Bacteroidota bacterium]MCB0845579.1 acyl-ACP--UDP-N-acetylglucosamine O-acyltransferase [Bacteroidota bacterium]